MSHEGNPHGRVLYGDARCPHCERRTRQTIEECQAGRRLCRVCTGCGRHTKIMDTTPEQVEHNRSAQTRTI